MNLRAFEFLVFFLITGYLPLKAQSLSAKVLESIFFVQPNGGGKSMVVNLNLDTDSLYQVMESQIKNVLNLESISRAHENTFIFNKRKNKFFKQLTTEDISLANENPADLYLLFFLDIDPPYASLLSGHLIKTAISFKVFVFGKDFKLMQKLKGKKSSTGITTDADVDEYDVGAYDFFDFDHESFLFLFDKAMKNLSKSN